MFKANCIIRLIHATICERFMIYLLESITIIYKSTDLQNRKRSYRFVTFLFFASTLKICKFLSFKFYNFRNE